MNITRLKLPAFRSFVESTVWAIQPERGRALADYIEARASGRIAAAPGSVETAKREMEARSGDRRPITKSGGAIAVLPFYGVVAQRMDMMMAYCGGVSTEAFADAFDQAMADPNVSAIVIDCDSPGGNVQGTPELAKRILAARGKGKQIIAVANGTMASAAYWICSAADEVVATPSGEVGSIGVFCVHCDQSAMNDKIGLKYTLIKSGDHKAETNPFEPLSADAEAFLQSQVDEMNRMFVSAVAKQRGVDAKKVNADFGQGRCFTAKQALSAGLIDRVATLEETLNRLGAKNVGASGRPLSAAADAVGLRAADPETPEVDPEDDGEDDLCPECQGEMQNGVCQACGYAADDDEDEPDASARAESAAAAGDQHPVIPTTAGAVGAGASPSPDPRPHVGEELAMDEQVKTALAAERKRAAGIRALARDHQIAEPDIDALVESGVDENAAAAQILTKVKARHAAGAVITVGADRAAERPFANAGEQLQAVIQAGKTGRVDRRLLHVNAQAMKFAGSPSGMNESVGSEGGFYLQNDLLPGIVEPVYADDPVLSRVKRIPIGDGKNGIKFNVVDETSRADGSRFGGIQMFYADEADAGTPKKPKLRRVELELRKIIGLAYLTDELMQDAPAAQTLIVDAFQTELRFMIATGIWRGPGANAPLGFIKSNAFVAQAIEAAQTIANTAASISQNVAKMLMHIPAGLLSDVIWLYNPELLPTLLNATVGNTSIPVFVPMAGLSDQSAVDRILGRPAFASEQAEAVGTPGDIVAICPSQYALADKGGPTVATSLHVRFVNDEEALRITYRYDGQPIWAQSVTPYKGSAARTPYVGLAARA